MIVRPPPIAGRWARIQAKIDTGYAKAARVLGQPFLVYRPLSGAPPIVEPNRLGVINADFTNARASGFNYEKGVGPEDVEWYGLFAGTEINIGDYLVSSLTGIYDGATYFVAAMPPLKPITCILCNRTVSHLRGNSQLDADGGQGESLPSQTGGSGRYFGYDSTPDTDDVGPGERTLAQKVPVALVPLAGAARGQGQVPTDAPGPGRWRMYLPVSIFPLGSVSNGDIFADETGSRYQVATNGWSSTGYKVEMIRLEN
ncbi:hypothetical protein SB2_11770 [Methylobacterium radiotolerans]|nr:hypothetical protein SB3_10965 [Methylobacterium radiotolerans]KTS47971.1 hypothetical protein SB2_11770 [Methylobacterium radiotolerans]